MYVNAPFMPLCVIHDSFSIQSTNRQDTIYMYGTCANIILSSFSPLLTPKQIMFHSATRPSIMGVMGVNMLTIC